MTEPVFYSKNAHVAYITIDCQQINSEILSQLVEEMKRVCSDIIHDNDVFVVVLTGKGENFFCGVQEYSGSQPYNSIASKIAGIDRPVIAAINGDALGQGLELALACDIRIASNTVHFGLPQITKGCFPKDGGTQRLPRLIGRGKAMELILTGDIISAAEALEIGLIHKAVPGSDLAAEVKTMAATMSAKGVFSLKYAKEAVIKGADLTLEQGLRLEADLYMLLHTTADRTEGIQAFRKKIPPNFKGK